MQVENPSLWVFGMSAVSLMLTPGPAKLFLAGMSTANGFRTGAAIAGGILASDAIHVTLVAAGLAVLINESPLARTIIGVAGAFFLAYMAYGFLKKALTKARDGVQLPATSTSTNQKRSAFFTGLFLNVSNPLAIAFYLSFLPQFVNHGAGYPAWIQIAWHGYALILCFFTFHIIISKVASVITVSSVNGKYMAVAYYFAAAMMLWLSARILLSTFA